MSTPTTTKASSVTLSGPGDWVEWLEVVKSTAATGQVWEYVDPSKTEVPTLSEPHMPEPKDINSTATTIQGLSDAERLELREQRELYRFNLTRYDRRRNAWAELQRHIQSTVARSYVHHTFKCDTVHKMLVNLQKRLKPKDDVRRLQLIDQYRELQKPPTDKNIDSWLLNWEKVYKEASELDDKIADKHSAVQDFLRAVSETAPDFASFWTNTIQSQDDLEKRPDLYDVIDRFRTQRQILGTGNKSGSSHAAFATAATLQG
jgi:vacuolar-type H+-ATPase subunit I/STV1